MPFSSSHYSDLSGENLPSSLAHDGYLVYKLLPYGVVREVVPYLARRAQENRGAMKSAQIERELLGKEIRQRLLSVFGR